MQDFGNICDMLLPQIYYKNYLNQAFRSNFAPFEAKNLFEYFPPGRVNGAAFPRLAGTGASPGPCSAQLPSGGAGALGGAQTPEAPPLRFPRPEASLGRRKRRAALAVPQPSGFTAPQCLTSSAFEPTVASILSFLKLF